MINIVKTKRNYIIALAVLFVFISLSDTTYSLFLKNDTTEEFNYKTGLLDLQFVEDEQIVLENAFPMNDSEQSKLTPYNLTIKNTGSLPYLFDLKMVSNEEENVIDSKYIKVKVNDMLPVTLFNTSNIIASNIIIYPNEEITFKIKIWLDANTPNKELGKTFASKIITTGNSVYKTIDNSGANHPKLTDDMIPIYYDSNSSTWRIADKSNTIESYKWYNYNDKMWANTITLKNSSKKIYDLTRTHDLDIESITVNNGNAVIEDEYLDIGLRHYNYDNITNIFRIKFNDLTSNYVYIISSENISFYYNSMIKSFVFSNGINTVTSKPYDLSTSRWYILGYTYDGNTLSFYVDGNKLSTGTVTGKIDNTESFKIGTDKTFSQVSKITIGDVLIYSKILKDSEIHNNYSSSINIIYDNLLCGYSEFTPMTLTEYYRNKNVGSPVNNKDISSFLVWIPRFKYKLWNVTGESGIDSYDAYHKGIDIVFENNNNSSGVIYCKDSECYSDELGITKVSKNDNGKYYTHPAFKNTTGDVTGLWVSKYEISTDTLTCNETNTTGCTNSKLTVESKPGNTAWRNNYLSNYYQAVINMNHNYHIIKNTEWGGVAYLSHSKYGLCNNNTCGEIGNNTSYISGSQEKDSTTGNNYGVFDMSGSAIEFTMSNYADSNNNINFDYSSFDDTPISNNDYELYSENMFILGDATKELLLENGSWYNNTSNYININNNWFIRGGNTTGNYKGIFSYSATNDKPSEYISTRFVLK